MTLGRAYPVCYTGHLSLPHLAEEEGESLGVEGGPVQQPPASHSPRPGTQEGPVGSAGSHWLGD